MDTVPTTGPFIAWTDSDGWASGPSPLRRSCEAHLRVEMAKLRPLVGEPAIEGIVVYDRLERGLAVAALMGSQGRTLPFTADGASCDGLFDEMALFNATTDHRFMAAVHQGSRGMLFRIQPDESRRVLLLPRFEASLFSPLGRKGGGDLDPASVGLLAHELAHARDYANGRPGRPTVEEVAARCDPLRVDALHAITDMALAEYVATRTECAAQVAAFGGCAPDLLSRVGPMARSTPPPVRWGEAPVDPMEAAQLRVDRGHLGYTVGTLAAYKHAAAPIKEGDGASWGQTTEEMVARATPRGSAMGVLIKTIGPALERAASAPSVKTRGDLARAVESSITAVEARAPRRAAARADAVR